MSRNAFLFLLTEIQSNDVFQNNSRNPQIAVWIQTIVALERLDNDGNANSGGKIARNMDIGYGTVNLYTQRVIIALLSLEKK